MYILIMSDSKHQFMTDQFIAITHHNRRSDNKWLKQVVKFTYTQVVYGLFTYSYLHFKFII